MTVGSTKIHEIQLFHKIPVELKWICPFDFALQISCLEDGSWSFKLGVFSPLNCQMNHPHKHKTSMLSGIQDLNCCACWIGSVDSH